MCLSDVTARGSFFLWDLTQSLTSQGNASLHVYVNGNCDYALNIQAWQIFMLKGGCELHWRNFTELIEKRASNKKIEIRTENIYYFTYFFYQLKSKNGCIY